ncbi:MAG: hypothetical protein V5A46_03095 [Haloferacaceae archaeon]
MYHARREDDREPPPEARERIELAYEYPSLLDAPDRKLRRETIDLDPGAYRRNLGRLRERDDWAELARPSRTRVLLSGKDCRGIAHKLLDGGADAPDVPSIVSPGSPPEEGVWNHHRVRAVAAAKALAWERGRQVPRALVEYPAHGVVRTVRLTTRAKAAYRAALRAVRSIDGPPPRANDARCDGCQYARTCGVRTRSLRSLIGL